MLRSLLVAGLLTAVSAPAAHAASGSLADPAGDFPDIVKLTYANKTDRVVMTMKYSGSRPQNESFYMRWGRDASKYYQVFVSSGITMKVLRLNGSEVSCGSLGVSHDPTTRVTKVVVRRSCLSAAPNNLRFKGIATEGLANADETALSAAISRG